MDAVTVVTQERAREDAPWVDVPWANTEHRLALLSGGRRPEGPWSVSVQTGWQGHWVSVDAQVQ